MSNEHALTKISLGLDIAAVFLLFIYFIAVAPYPPITGLGGMLIFSPPLFGILGLIAAVLGRKKIKSNISIALIIINIIFICWWPVVWYGGTLIFGI